MKEYKEDNFIQIIEPGMIGFGKFKYRGVNQIGWPTYYTNYKGGARKWLNSCIKDWKEEEKEQ